MRTTKTTKSKPFGDKLVREIYNGESYEYYPLGKYVVSAPGVCGGRPTFKYTRLEVSMILSRIAAGKTIEQVVQDYARSHLAPEAVMEAIQLADKALVQSTRVLQLAAWPMIVVDDRLLYIVLNRFEMRPRFLPDVMVWLVQQSNWPPELAYRALDAVRPRYRSGFVTHSLEQLKGTLK